MNNETIGDRFATGKDAEKIFALYVPSKWLIREQNPDIFVDYMIETTVNGEPTGIQFGAQLKGTIPKKGKSIPMKYSLKTKQLFYYLEKSRVPVFLFLADIKSRQVYWVFTQKYAKDNFKKDVIEKQKNVTVHFSPQDALTEFDRFEKALSYAIAYVNDLHPGSIPASLDYEKRRLQAIEPRLAFDIKVLGGVPHIQVQPLEDFTVKTSFRNAESEELKKKIRDFFEKGSELRIKASEVEFTGSPIFAEMFKGGTEELVIERGKAKGEVRLFSNSDSETRFFIEISGKFQGGTKQGYFQAELLQAPLKIKCSLDINRQALRLSTFKISFNTDNWAGQTISRLRYFEDIYKCVNTCAKKEQFQFEIYFDGNALFKGDLLDQDPNAIRDSKMIFDWIYKCRQLSERYKVDPVFPKISKITKEYFMAIEELYALSFQEQHSMKCPNFAMNVTGSAVREILERAENGSETGDFFIQGQKQEFDFFGHKIEVGPLDYKWTFTKIIFEQHDSISGKTKIKVQGTTESHKIISIRKQSRCD